MQNDQCTKMIIFERGHRLTLPKEYWLQKANEDRWQVGLDKRFLSISLISNVPVGTGGSIDQAIKNFAEAMYSPTYDEVISGNFSKNWVAVQRVNLPKHLVNHNEKPVTCACGERFNSIIEWSYHATRGTHNKLD